MKPLMAAIAVGHRAHRLAFALMRSGEPYDPARLVESVVTNGERRPKKADLHFDQAVIELSFEGLQGGLTLRGGQPAHQLSAQVLDELVAAGESLFAVVDVRPVGRGLDLFLEGVQELLGVRGGHHADEDAGGGASAGLGYGFGVEDVGEAGPAAQVEVAGGDVDGVEVLQGLAEG
jgi:hypothetical protein